MTDELDPPCVANSDTSQAAAASMKSHTPRLRGEVLSLFKGRWEETARGDCFLPGKDWTCDEIEQELGMSHQTISPRVHELAKLGLIVDSGARRKTRSGRTATIWRLAP